VLPALNGSYAHGLQWCKEMLFGRSLPLSCNTTWHININEDSQYCAIEVTIRNDNSSGRSAIFATHPKITRDRSGPYLLYHNVYLWTESSAPKKRFTLYAFCKPSTVPERLLLFIYHSVPYLLIFSNPSVTVLIILRLGLLVRE